MEHKPSQMDYALNDDPELEQERRRNERYWEAYDNRTRKLNDNAIKLWDPFGMLKQGYSLMDQLLIQLIGKEVYIITKDNRSLRYVTLKAFDSESVLLCGLFTERLIYREIVFSRSEIKIISQG